MPNPSCAPSGERRARGVEERLRRRRSGRHPQHLRAGEIEPRQLVLVGRPPGARARRTAAPAPAPEPEEDDDYGFGPMTTSTGVSTGASGGASAGVSSGSFGSPVLSVNKPAAKQEVVLFRPNSFNDITKAADDLCANRAVVVNMEGVDKAMARRVVDFLSGSVYALQGSVTKIAQSAYLFCPHNMDVLGDLESIQAEVESYI